MQQLLTIAAMFVLAISSSARAEEELEIFRKKFFDQCEITVVRSPVVAAEKLKHLLLEDQRVDLSFACTLTMKLVVADAPPLDIWSRLFWIRSAEEPGRFFVLDQVFSPKRDKILMLIAAPDSAIWLCEVSMLPNSSRIYYFGGGIWSRIAAIIPLDPRRMSGTISFTEDGGAIQVEIMDSMEGTTLHSRYLQKPETFVFPCVEQWDQKGGVKTPRKVHVQPDE